MSNSYGRQVVLTLTNKSGGGVIAGDVVVVDTGNNEAFTTSTAGAVTGGVGIAQETIANNATGRVLVHGYAALVNTSASVTRGNYGKTHTVVKQAVDMGSSRGAGAFCQFLTGGTTPTARVFSPDLAAAAGNVATDTIWDAAGDLAVGSGADTAAKLTKGAAGAHLSIINAAVAWNSGTSNPGSAVAGDRYWRTDLGMEIYYDGTRWLSVEIFELRADFGAAAITVSANATNRPGLWQPTFDIWLIAIRGMTYVSTTNNGTNYWTVILAKFSDDSTIASFTTAADSPTTPTGHVTAIGASSTEKSVYFVASKTLSPGAFYPSVFATYRLIVT